MQMATTQKHQTRTEKSGHCFSISTVIVCGRTNEQPDIALLVFTASVSLSKISSSVINSTHNHHIFFFSHYDERSICYLTGVHNGWRNNLNKINIHITKRRTITGLVNKNTIHLHMTVYHTTRFWTRLPPGSR